MSSNWRNEPATEKQLNLIIEMNEFSQFPLPKFEGIIKGEAYDYIQANLQKSHECMDLYDISHC